MLVAATAVAGAATSAQAYEWGSGYGYGHPRVVVRDGYRGVRFHDRYDYDRPAGRIYERRSHDFRHHHHWDDDDDDD